MYIGSSRNDVNDGDSYTKVCIKNVYLIICKDAECLFPHIKKKKLVEENFSPQNIVIKIYVNTWKI